MRSAYEWYLLSQDKVPDGILHLVAGQRPTPGRTSQGAAALADYRLSAAGGCEGPPLIKSVKVWPP